MSSKLVNDLPCQQRQRIVARAHHDDPVAGCAMPIEMRGGIGAIGDVAGVAARHRRSDRRWSPRGSRCRPDRRGRAGSARPPAPAFRGTSRPIRARITFSGPYPCGWNRISSRPGKAWSVSSVAAILSGLCPKSSITVTPFASPTSSNRRLSPVKPVIAAAARGSGTPGGARGGDRGQRVRDIVAAGHAERDAGDAALRQQIEGHRERLFGDVDRAQVRIAVDRHGHRARPGRARRPPRLSILTIAVPARLRKSPNSVRSSSIDLWSRLTLLSTAMAGR